MKAIGLGLTNAGKPGVMALIAAKTLPGNGSDDIDVNATGWRTRVQNSFSFSSRSSGLLPAMMPALIAPIEVTMIQSGSIPASCNASWTPA